VTGQALAVVGTDTGVGKTTVTEALLLGLRERGLAAAGWKPVETGVPEGPVDPASDGARLARASGFPVDRCLGAAFPLPAAPLAAARSAGISLNIEVLNRGLDSLRQECALVLVEGAGGLCVPFAEGLLWADVLERWSLPTLVVGRLGLGTINHTLLTVAELRRRRLPVLGVVLCATAPATAEAELTPALLEEFGALEVLGVVPHGPPPAAEIASLLLASSLGDWLKRCPEIVTSNPGCQATIPW
jgi:dethiobiotin synthetase